VIVLTLIGVALAACGKKGPPEPPGPPNQITYPKAYPSR
jgi:predicted small lipoprotein YifL